MRIRLGIAFLLCLFLQVLGADASAIRRGSTELRLNAGFDRQAVDDPDGDDLLTATEAAIDFGYAHAVTDLVQVGASLGLIYRSIELDGGSGGDDSVTALRMTGDVIVNLGESTSAIPFVQGSIGFLRYGDDDGTDYEMTLILPALGAGVRVPIGNSAAAVAMLGLEYQLNALGVEELTAWDLSMRLGISAFPGGLR